jgi:hypothetical protein
MPIDSSGDKSKDWLTSHWQTLLGFGCALPLFCFCFSIPLMMLFGTSWVTEIDRFDKYLSPSDGTVISATVEEAIPAPQVHEQFSGMYVDVIERAQHNTLATRLIGTPIVFVRHISTNKTKSHGSTTLEIKGIIGGPQGEATVQMVSVDGFNKVMTFESKGEVVDLRN